MDRFWTLSYFMSHVAYNVYGMTINALDKLCAICVWVICMCVCCTITPLGGDTAAKGASDIHTFTL